MVLRPPLGDDVLMIASSNPAPVAINEEGIGSTIDVESRAWIDRLTRASLDLETGIEELRSLLLRTARFELNRRRGMLPQLWGEDYEDLAQQSARDALLAVLRKLPDFRGESRFTTWPSRFALLEAPASARTRAWQGRKIPTAADRWSLSLDSGLTGQESVEMKELFAALTEAMETRLSTDQREVLIAVVLDGVPINVLAARLGRSQSAIYKTIHNARKKLRAAIGTWGFDTSGACQGKRE